MGNKIQSIVNNRETCTFMKNKYGCLPTHVANVPIEVTESMFYLYMPIKLHGTNIVKADERLMVFAPLIAKAQIDYVRFFGIKALTDVAIYITAKHGIITPTAPGNRPGYHSDGFMTEDINYIWCDRNPTIFNTSAFSLTQDDEVSLAEMEQQALKTNEVAFGPYALLRLNQYNIHKVATPERVMARTFVKLSFSMDRYDLIGNTHNYKLDYNWDMKERKAERNIPQSKIG